MEDAPSSGEGCKQTGKLPSAERQQTSLVMANKMILHRIKAGLGLKRYFPSLIGFCLLHPKFPRTELWPLTVRLAVSIAGGKAINWNRNINRLNFQQLVFATLLTLVTVPSVFYHHRWVNLTSARRRWSSSTIKLLMRDGTELCDTCVATRGEAECFLTHSSLVLNKIIILDQPRRENLQVFWLQVNFPSNYI